MRVIFMSQTGEYELIVPCVACLYVLFFVHLCDLVSLWFKKV